MLNAIADGNSLQIIAPSGGVVGGGIVAVGKLVGLPVADALEGEQYTLMITGSYRDVPKAASESWAIGDMLYLKADGSSLTKTSTSNTFAGYAHAAADSAAVLGEILLSH